MENPQPASGRRFHGWPILSLGDIVFVLEPSFLVFIGIIFFWEVQNGGSASGAGLLAFVVFFSLMAHEAGHAAVARLYGLRPIRVSLVMFGGNTSHPATTHGKSFFITLAGPAASLALVALAWLLARDLPAAAMKPATAVLVKLFFGINLFWAAFNLLPILPMDGGMLVYHGLGHFLPQRRVHLFVAWLSLACCGILGYLALTTRSFFLLIFVFMFFMQNLDIIRAGRR